MRCTIHIKLLFFLILTLAEPIYCKMTECISINSRYIHSVWANICNTISAVS